MNLNLHVDKKLEAKVNGKEYPVLVSGEGIPCLAIGIGTLMQRTLSKRFKSHFRVYSSDLYWDQRHALANSKRLTMEQILLDILELGKSLKLQKYVLFGHSAYGIVALEFAKQFPTALAGIILVGTPPHSNSEVAKRNDEYFNQHASPDRLLIDKLRREEYAREDTRSSDPSKRFLREYIWRDGPRYWHNPHFDCTPLWEDIIVDEVLDHFFTNILPQNDIEKHLDTIRSPIFLAAGLSDYDCLPAISWLEIKNRPKQMIISEFKESGHYPNYEEEALFDERIEMWISKISKR